MPRPIRVLELRSVWGTGGGPDKTILAGAAIADRGTVETTVCYVRDARDTVFAIDCRARDLGIDYVEIIEQHSFDRSVWPALRKLVRERGIDIVHAHDQKTDFLTWLLGRRERIIPFSTAHGFAGDSHKERFYYAVEKRLLATFPRVIAVSNPIRDELIRTGSRPERVVVVNNGIDENMFRRGPHEDAPFRHRLRVEPGQTVIGAVGRLESEKRFDLLLRAFARLTEAYPRSVLVIAGEGRLRSELEGLARELHVDGACRFVGHVRDIVGLHRALDVFVQSSEREGTPNAVLEAMAMETPIAATAVGGTPELMTDRVHGLLVPPHDEVALARAIGEILGDPHAARERAVSARGRVETTLSFAARVRRVEGLYREVVSNHPAVGRPVPGSLPSEQ